MSRAANRGAPVPCRPTEVASCWQIFFTVISLSPWTPSVVCLRLLLHRFVFALDHCAVLSRFQTFHRSTPAVASLNFRPRQFCCVVMSRVWTKKRQTLFSVSSLCFSTCIYASGVSRKDYNLRIYQARTRPSLLIFTTESSSKLSWKKSYWIHLLTPWPVIRADIAGKAVDQYATSPVPLSTSFTYCLRHSDLPSFESHPSIHRSPEQATIRYY